MDQYYQSQIQMPYFKGAARQRGSGLAAPLVLGRMALPLLQKYGLPIAKQLGQTILTSALPELIDVVTRRKKPKAAAKSLATKAKNQAAIRAKAALMKNVLPEVADILEGKAKPKQALKKMMQQTIKDQIGGGGLKKKKVIKRKVTGQDGRFKLLKNLQQ